MPKRARCPRMKTDTFSSEDRARIEAQGLTLEEVERQAALLRHPPPAAVLLRPCTAGDGVMRIDEGDHAALLALANEAARAGRLSKFVPASGAASRMFEFLRSSDPGHPDVRRFRENASSFAFDAGDLQALLAPSERPPPVPSVCRGSQNTVRGAPRRSGGDRAGRRGRLPRPRHRPARAPLRVRGGPRAGAAPPRTGNGRAIPGPVLRAVAFHRHRRDRRKGPSLPGFGRAASLPAGRARRSPEKSRGVGRRRRPREEHRQRRARRPPRADAPLEAAPQRPSRADRAYEPTGPTASRLRRRAQRGRARRRPVLGRGARRRDPPDRRVGAGGSHESRAGGDLERGDALQPR